MKTSVAVARIGVLITTLAFVPVDSRAGDRDDHNHHRPVHISIHAPNAGHSQGLTTTSGWAFVLRIDAKDSVTICRTRKPATSRCASG